MRAILVTVPKSERKNIAAEEKAMGEETCTQFWSMKRKPKHVGVGDRIYFIEDGNITSYHLVDDIQDGKMHCDITDRDWNGCNFLLGPLVMLTSPMPCKGFRGFRYIGDDMLAELMTLEDRVTRRDNR